MNRTGKLFLISLLALVWSATASLAQSSLVTQKRIALVIGNSNYTKLQSLPNPANDSKLMAKTLRKLDFEVVATSDADFLGMRRAIKEFGRKLRASGKDTVGLFYYAGHGVQVQGTNFLIPLGAEVSAEADLEVEAITASDVLVQMEAAGNSFNMVILDACRNNPYKGTLRSNTRGLARLTAASGSLVAFAAAPGQVAADGDGENSPYTAALVEAMQVPGLSVEQMFKRVRISVEAATDNQQTPWEESSLRGDFYFNPQKVAPEYVATPEINPAAQEWATIQNTRSTAVLKAFIKRYPGNIYAEYARVTLEEKTATLTKQKQPQAEKAKPPVPEISQDQQIASLQRNTGQRSIRPKPLNRRQMTILLQQQLTRVGCDPGEVDGQWGRKSRRALVRFKRFAKIKLPYSDLSPEVVDAVKQKAARVCPEITFAQSRDVRKVVKNRKARKSSSKKISRREFCLSTAKEFDADASEWC